MLKPLKGHLMRIFGVGETEYRPFLGPGLQEDRYCSNDTKRSRQISFIKSENIDYFNNVIGAKPSYHIFHRSLVTERVQLNDLVGRTFYVGKVHPYCHELYEPCRSLQEKFKAPNLVNRLTLEGEICCEILADGQIYVGDDLFRF